MKDVSFSSLDFFLANENEAGYYRDQCCHIKGDGVSFKPSNRATEDYEKPSYESSRVLTNSGAVLSAHPFFSVFKFAKQQQRFLKC